MITIKASVGDGKKAQIFQQSSGASQICLFAKLGCIRHVKQVSMNWVTPVGAMWLNEDTPDAPIAKPVTPGW